MNRKKFLVISGLAASGLAVPVLARWNRNRHPDKPLIHPGSLAPLFDEETIRGIGVAYRSATPSEDGAQELTRLLLTSPDGVVLSTDDTSWAKRMLEQKVHRDFETGNIVVVNGWILSVTEARQCALFSVTEPGPA
jgi:hypothetical protein